MEYRSFFSYLFEAQPFGIRKPVPPRPTTTRRRSGGQARPFSNAEKAKTQGLQAIGRYYYRKSDVVQSPEGIWQRRSEKSLPVKFTDQSGRLTAFNPQLHTTPKSSVVRKSTWPDHGQGDGLPHSNATGRVQSRAPKRGVRWK